MTRAVDSVKFLNNRPRMAEVFTTTAQVYQRLGQYQESFDYFERAYQAGLRAENPQHQVWGLNGMAGILLYRGEENHALQAKNLLNRSIPFLTGSTDHTEDIRAYGMLGIANIRLSQLNQARLNADKGLHFISTNSPTAHDALEGYAGVVETYLHLLEQNSSDKELNRKTRKALKGLLNCAKLFPIVMPRYWCYQGWYAWIYRNKNKANENCKKGLKLAEQFNMKYEEARLYLEMGRHDLSSDKLGKALDAEYDRNQVLKLIN
jgi:tetratricopeptide (TPR) repeat protein